jgi:hypothetical protein
MRGVPPLSSKYLLEILGSAARETATVDRALFYVGSPPASSSHVCNSDTGHRASERSIVFHVARRLVPHVPGLNVDVEYNRHGKGRDAVAKALRSYEKVDPEKKVLPDVIIHARGNDEHNLLVVECKINADTPGDDTSAWCQCANKEVVKLAAYRHDFDYQTAVFLNFSTDRKESEAGPVGIATFCIGRDRELELVRTASTGADRVSGRWSDSSQSLDVADQR